MAKLVVLYRTPQDKTAFDRYYADTHIPMAKKIPGLKRYEISRGDIASPAGPTDIHLIATLHFATMDDLQKAMASAEGQAAAADVGNFASGGADLYIFEDVDV